MFLAVGILLCDELWNLDLHVFGRRHFTVRRAMEFGSTEEQGQYDPAACDAAAFVGCRFLLSSPSEGTHTID
jgi:hypothetical protein